MSKATGRRPSASTVTLEMPPRLSAPRHRAGWGLQQQNVENACQWCPVATRSDVAVAHVAHDGRAGALGDPGGLAELERAESPVSRHPVENRLAVRAHELYWLRAKSREVGRDLAEELTYSDVKLTDLPDVGWCRGKHCRDPPAEVLDIRDRTVRHQVAQEAVALRCEFDQHRLDGVEGCPGDHPDHPHWFTTLLSGHLTGLTASSCEGRWRRAIRRRAG